jgi:hypothetical protein
MLMAMPQQPIAAAGATVRARRRGATARPGFLALVCAAGLVGADQASARDYASREIGGWTAVASRDGKGCFLTREYERGTSLLLGLDIDGTNRLSVLNPDWSIKPKDQLKLNFRLSNSSYPAHFAVGIASDGKQGFVASFGAKFPTYFAASTTLDISRGDVPVARLSLDGSGAAVSELRTCVEAQREKPAAASAEKPHHDDIPSDPFAPAGARGSKK